MLPLWQFWPKVVRALRGRRRSRAGSRFSPPRPAVLLEERRLLNAAAVVDNYAIASTGTLATSDASGAATPTPADNGVLANDTGLVSVASTGTTTTAQGATVSMNADGTFAYDPSTSSAIQALAPGASLVDTFQYTAQDGGGNFYTGEVQVQSTNSGNHAPELDATTPHVVRVLAQTDYNNGGDPADLIAVCAADVYDDDVSYYPPDVGIAVVGTTSSDGVWQYSLDGGSSWNDVGSVSPNAALLLGMSDRIRFVPGGSAEQPSFQFKAWDQTQGAAGQRADTTFSGGPTAFSAETGTGLVNVWTLKVPFDPVYDHNGNTQLTFELSQPAASYYDVTINWGDGTTQALGLLANGTYTVAHHYSSSPSAGSQAPPIPILIEATEQSGRGCACEDLPLPDSYSPEDCFLTSTRVLTTAFPAFTGITPGTSPWPPASPGFPSPAIGLLPTPLPRPNLLPMPTTRVLTGNIDIRTGASYVAANPLTQYVLRVVTPIDAQGSVRESGDKPLPRDVLNDLPALYRRLENDRYRVYELRRDGSYRLVQDVIVRDGVAKPVEDQQQAPVRPPVPDGASAVPGKPALLPAKNRVSLPLGEDGDEVLRMPLYGPVVANGAATVVIDGLPHDAGPADLPPARLSPSNAEAVRAATPPPVSETTTRRRDAQSPPLSAAGAGLSAGLMAGAEVHRRWAQRVDRALESQAAVRRFRRRILRKVHATR